MTNNKLLYYSSSKTQDYIELYKDPGEIPYYICKIYGYTAIFDDYSDSELPLTMFRMVKLMKYAVNPKGSLFLKGVRILKLARKIDIFYLLQITPDSLLKMLIYRLGGGKGKIYLKLDLGRYERDGKDMLVWKNMSFPLKIGHLIFKRLPDIYTVETSNAFNRLKNTYYGNLISQNKLFMLPNGFDTEILAENSIERKHVSEKEKIIITVGRLGSYEKNTDLFLDILSELDLKDWKVYLIGAINPNFKEKIALFFTSHPEKVGKVIFTGQIAQKKELYEYYNKSRVFVLTSRWESYAFVLSEAAYFNNYLISTDVGAVQDLTKYAHGFISNEQKKEPLKRELQRVISLSDNDLNSLVLDVELQEITWQYIIQRNPAIKKLVSYPN